MARAAKKQAPAKVEEDDDTEGWDDAVVEADSKESGADLRLRDWRDVERFREMKELRSLVDDDYGLDEIFRVPLKPRGDLRAKSAAPAKGPLAPPAKPAAKPAAAASAGAAAKPEAPAAAVAPVASNGATAPSAS